MFAVSVTFKIDEPSLLQFMPLMLRNARTSLANEPGCHRFDVLTDPDRPGDVFLYELYTDQSAFQTHLESPHFKTFDQAVASMILSKDIRTYAQVDT